MRPYIPYTPGAYDDRGNFRAYSDMSPEEMLAELARKRGQYATSFGEATAVPPRFATSFQAAAPAAPAGLSSSVSAEAQYGASYPIPAPDRADAYASRPEARASLPAMTYVSPFASTFVTAPSEGVYRSSFGGRRTRAGRAGTSNAWVQLASTHYRRLRADGVNVTYGQVLQALSSATARNKKSSPMRVGGGRA